VPYFQGGGQWHPAFTYNDKYFESGVDLLEYNENLFGYAGNYDQVVAYGKGPFFIFCTSDVAIVISL
jgi:hypothetical protein